MNTQKTVDQFGFWRIVHVNLIVISIMMNIYKLFGSYGLYLMSKLSANITTVGIIVIVIGAISAIPILTYGQQQQQTSFIANLSGKNITPQVNTPATGTAKFHLNPNGTLSYEVDVSNIDRVIGAHIGTKNGTELADLVNPYASVNHQPVFPTGPVNGMLSSGVITGDKLFGPLFGKNVTDLVKVINSKSAYVTVRTTQNQHGEIQGQIVPSG